MKGLIVLLDPQRYTTPAGVVMLDRGGCSCVAAAARALRTLASCEKNAEALTRTPVVEYLVALLDTQPGGQGRKCRDSDCDYNCKYQESECNAWQWEVAEAAACALGGVAYNKEVKVEIARTDGSVRRLVRLVLEGTDRYSPQTLCTPKTTSDSS